MSKLLTLDGNKYGRLLVIGLDRISNKKSYWLCKCDCGNSASVRSDQLKSGRSKSCGCFGKEQRRNATVTHGKSRTPEYKAWTRMKERCLNKNDKGFKNYGGRGIIVCDRWKNNFSAFLDDMGERPSKKHSIDRIENNKNYEPSNCKWSTRTEQNNNMRSNHFITINNKIKTIAQWSKKYGVESSVIVHRLNRAGQKKRLLV